MADWPFDTGYIIIAIEKSSKGIWLFLVSAYVVGFFNVYLFSVVQLSLIAYILSCLDVRNPKNFFKYLGFCCLILGARIPLMIFPSAMTIGEAYEPISASLQLTQADFLQNLWQYLSLTNLLQLASLILALVMLRSRRIHERLTSILYIVAFFVPIIVRIENITIWDNHHKSVVLCSFLGIFVLANFIASRTDHADHIIRSNFATMLRGSSFFVLVGATLIMSLPAAYNLVQSRTIFGEDFSLERNYLMPVDRDLAAYLNAQVEQVMLWPFPSAGLCGALAHSISHTSVSVAGLYSPMFLLAEHLEQRVKDEANWYQEHPSKFLSKFKNKTNWVVVGSEYLIEFHETMEKEGVSRAFIYASEHFHLFTLSWQGELSYGH